MQVASKHIGNQKWETHFIKQTKLQGELE